MALWGDKVKLDEILFGNSTARQLISQGVFVNTITRGEEEIEVVPRMTPVALRALAQKAYNGKRTSAHDKAIAKCIRMILNCDSHFDGNRFEEFHAWWEVLRRLLFHDRGEPLNITLHEFYGIYKPSSPGICFSVKEGVINFPKLNLGKDGDRSFPPPPGAMTSDRIGLTKELLLENISRPPPGNPVRIKIYITSQV